MRSVLISLLMLTIHTHAICSCPTSCVLCTPDAIICHQVSSIIEIPRTIQALMLTDGLIETVDNITLSDLSNITLLGLSNNIISSIMDNAFQNLTLLKTLLLDHNYITSNSIHDSTFSLLHDLEILQLGNNALHYFNSSWLKKLKNLLTLHLEGNFITRIESGTFESANLRNLEVLDLSDNLIEFIAKCSFCGLPRLRRLNLSRNSLRTAPDAFSYLSWLSALNLDFNQWNCTCELQELASFLNSYIQAPDKVLYNGRQMVCFSAANPSVQTVLQLTEANCVPPNKNITVFVKSTDSIGVERYARDVSLAACFFFLGGVGVAVVILYIIYKPELKNGLIIRSREEEIISRGIAEQTLGTPQWNFTEENGVQIMSFAHPGQEAKLMHPNCIDSSHQRPFTTEKHKDRDLRHRPKQENFFTCHHCSPAVSGHIGSHGSRNVWNRIGHGSVKREKGALPDIKSIKDFNDPHQPKSSKVVYRPRRHANLKQIHINTEKKSEEYVSHCRQLSLPIVDSTDIPILQSTQNSLKTNVGSIPENENITSFLRVKCVHCEKYYEYKLAGYRNTNKSTELSDERNLRRRHSTLKTKLYKEGSVKDPDGVEHHGNEWDTLPLQRNVTFNLTESDIERSTSVKKRKHRKKKTAVLIGSNGDILQGNLKFRPLSVKGMEWKSRASHRVLGVKLNLNPFRKSRVHPDKKTLKMEELLTGPNSRTSRKHRNSTTKKGIQPKHEIEDQYIIRRPSTGVKRLQLTSKYISDTQVFASKTETKSNKKSRNTYGAIKVDPCLGLQGDADLQRDRSIKKSDNLLTNSIDGPPDQSIQDKKPSRSNSLVNTKKSPDTVAETKELETQESSAADMGTTSEAVQNAKLKNEQGDENTEGDTTDVKDINSEKEHFEHEESSDALLKPSTKHINKDLQSSEAGGDTTTVEVDSDQLIEPVITQSLHNKLGQEPSSADVGLAYGPEEEQHIEAVPQPMQRSLSRNVSQERGESLKAESKVTLIQSESSFQLKPTEPMVQVTPDNVGSAEGTELLTSALMGTMGSSSALPVKGDSTNSTRLEPSPGSSVIQEYIPLEDGSPGNKIRLIIPERKDSKPQPALYKKIR